MMAGGDLGVDCVQSNPIYNLKTRLDNSDANDDIYGNVEHVCNYYDSETFHREFCNDRHKFSTFSYNIRSLPNKWVDFQNMISDLNKNDFNFSVVAVQEVWNVPSGVTYDLPGYRSFHYKIRDPSGRNNNAGGGIGLWVNDNLDYDVIEELSVLSQIFSNHNSLKLKQAKLNLQ